MSASASSRPAPRPDTARSGKSGCTFEQSGLAALRHSAPNTTCPCPPSMPGNAACACSNSANTSAAADRAHQPRFIPIKLLPASTPIELVLPTGTVIRGRTAAIWTSFAPWSRLWEVPRAEPLTRRPALVLSDTRRHASGVRWFACPGEQSSPRGSLFGSSVHLPKQARRPSSTGADTDSACGASVWRPGVTTTPKPPRTNPPWS